jgi:uncharacterized protein
MTGRVVHFEIPFDDGDRARGFYKEAFGWNLQEIPDMNYTIVTSGPATEEGRPSEPGFVNGGMLKRDLSPSGGPVVTIDVESIDAALERIQQLGGSTVVAKQEVGDMGYSAYFKDPEGNVMGLWETAGQG